MTDKHKYVFLLILWVFFLSATTLVWISKNTVPPPWDQANYLAASESLFQSLIDKGPLNFLEQTTTVLARKAPLIAILPVPLYVIFGSSPQIALVVNVCFFIIFCWFFYLLVSRFFGEKVSTTSILIISTMPLFYGLLRNFFVEFILMTLVIIYLYVLLLFKNVTRYKYLFWLGIIMGLGMLAKLHFFLFATGPFLYVLYLKVKKQKPKIEILRTLALITIPALVIAGPWYFRNIKTVLWHAKRATNPELLGSYYYGSPFSIKTIYLSTVDLINFAFSSYWFVILVILIAFFLLKRKKISINYFFLSAYLPPFLVFFFGPNKDYRLMLPILPAAGILISFLYWKLLPKGGAKFLPFVMVLPVLMYLNTSILKIPFLDNRVALGNIIITDKKIGTYVQRPIGQYWQIEEVLLFIEGLDSEKPKTVVLASEHEFFNINNLIYLNTLKKLNLTLKTASYFPKSTQTSEIISFIETGDFLMMKVDGEMGPVDLNRFNKTILDNLDYSKWVSIPNNFSFPDNGRLLLFRKMSQS